MKRSILKPLMAAAVAVTGLATTADAHDTRLMLSRLMTAHTHVAPMFTTRSLQRAMDFPIMRAPMVRVPGVLTRLKLSFDCVVAGTPVEFPNDIRISNPYSFTVAAGTVATYSAPFGNSGTVVLPALAPGAGVYVSNAVPGGITAGAACSASEM